MKLGKETREKNNNLRVMQTEEKKKIRAEITEIENKKPIKKMKEIKVGLQLIILCHVTTGSIIVPNVPY